MSDVKVYVDLASISAGENDTEIDQVAGFHDAVMGYAPLFYSLSPKAGFEEFMKSAQQVWDAQRRDEKLPDKLVRTSPPSCLFIKLCFCGKSDNDSAWVCFPERVYSVAELAAGAEGDSRLCGAVLPLFGFFY